MNKRNTNLLILGIIVLAIIITITFSITLRIPNKNEGMRYQPSFSGITLSPQRIVNNGDSYNQNCLSVYKECIDNVRPISPERAMGLANVANPIFNDMNCVSNSNTKNLYMFAINNKKQCDDRLANCLNRNCA